MTATPANMQFQGQGPLPEAKYYTAKNINATNGSRTAVSTALQVGSVLIQDQYGHDKGKGADVTQPQTSFLGAIPCVLLQVPVDNDAADNVRVAPHEPGKWCKVRVNGNSVNIAVGDPLVMANGSFNLVKGVAPLTGGQKVYFIAQEASTADGDLIDAQMVPALSLVQTTIAALTENSSTIGGTNDGNLPALVDPAGDSGASVIAGIREVATRCNSLRTALVTAGILT